MAPSYALLLDNDTIALHRLGDVAAASDDASTFGEPLGAVALEDAAFDAEMKRLRAMMPDSASEAPVLVVLPDSQVLYTCIPASGLDDEADRMRVINALDGATPYDLSELIYDWRPEGAALHIAVVAAETVSEAREFVVSHGFLPTRFSAGTSEGGFPGRPHFADPEAPAAPDAAISTQAPTPAYTGKAASAPPDDATHATGAATAPNDAVHSEPRDKSVETPVSGGGRERAVSEPEVPASAPLPFSSIRRSRDPDGAPGRGEAPAEPAEAEPAPAPAPAKRPTAPRKPRASATPVAAATPKVVAVETGDSATTSAASLAPSEAGRLSGLSGLSALARGALSQRAAGKNVSDAAPVQPPAPPKSATARPGVGNAQRLGRAVPPPSAAAPRAPDAAPRTPLPAASSEDVAAPIKRVEHLPSDTRAAPTGVAPSHDARLDEAESLTVFGARRLRSEAASRSQARFLGLGLTVALLAVIGLVALWSLWFDGDTATQTAVLAPTDSVVPLDGIETTPPADDAGATPVITPASPEPSDPDRSTNEATPADQPDAATDLGGLPPADAITPLEGTLDGATPPPAVTASPAAEPEDAAPTDMGAQTSIASLPPKPTEAPDQTRSAAAPLSTGASDPAPAMRIDPSPLDADAAEAVYAVSGIWQRAPTRGAAPDVSSRPGISLASVDPSRLTLSPPEAPSARRPDAPPPRSTEALPPGTRLDADGFVIPTDEGSLAPGGYLVYRGSPEIIPPARGDRAAGGQDEPTPGTADADGPATEGIAADTEDTGPEPEPEPNPLADARPLPRPVGLAPAPASAPEPASEAVPPAQGESAQSAPEVRPRTRPEDAGATPDSDTAADGPAPAEDEAAAVLDASPGAGLDPGRVESTPLLDGPRPRDRPADIAVEAQRLTTDAARAEQVAREEASAAAEALAAASVASATRLAVVAAPEPRARPGNISQIAARARNVQQEREEARAAAERQAAARAAATPERPPPPQPQAAPTSQTRGPAVARSQRLSPSAPTSARVAGQATQRNALRLSGVTLIGVYGASSQRRALVRLPSGRYVKVQVGDRLDGGRVAAIDRTAVRYVKSGRNHVLQMPAS